MNTQQLNTDPLCPQRHLPKHKPTRCIFCEYGTAVREDERAGCAQATRHASLGATVEWAGIQRARKAIADMENAGGYPQSVFDHIKADALDCIDALEGEWAAGYKEAIADAVSRVEALDWDEIGLTIRHLVIAAIKGEVDTPQREAIEHINLCAVCGKPLSGRRSGNSWRCDHCRMWRGVKGGSDE